MSMSRQSGSSKWEWELDKVQRKSPSIRFHPDRFEILQWHHSEWLQLMWFEREFERVDLRILLSLLILPSICLYAEQPLAVFQPKCPRHASYQGAMGRNPEN